MSATPATRTCGFELHFPLLVSGEQGLSFPCDADGRVDLDDLDTLTRDFYLIVQARVGLDFANPVVVPTLQSLH